MAWTEFLNQYGRDRRVPYDVILIELPKEEAIVAFQRIFGYDPRISHNGLPVGPFAIHAADEGDRLYWVGHQSVEQAAGEDRLRIIRTAELSRLLLPQLPPPTRSRVVTLFEEG